ncbi:unnamed protein product [Meloidogyne enterolobii]|uniref:Uncharacterized protein n=1 Tax=Meloidogyne enterolobii TaxID=390850 RepID=A0ACB0YP49_MELEN
MGKGFESVLERMLFVYVFACVVKNISAIEPVIAFTRMSTTIFRRPFLINNDRHDGVYRIAYQQNSITF